MANVIHRTTLQYIPSANTPDHPEPTWKHNPDMSAVAAVPTKYWKAPANWDATSTTGPVEMSAGEKTAVDAAETAARAAAIITGFDTSAPPGVFRCVIKPSVTTRTATTTLTADPHLTFPVEANKAYVFEYRIFYDTTAAADFKLTLTGPASPTGLRFYRSCVAPNATAFSSIGVSTAFNGGGLALTGTGTTGGYCEGRGILLNGANAGSVAVQWAQNTSDAGNTSVLTGSTLHWARSA